MNKALLKNKHAVIIRLSALGDVALTTGVLKYWHETYGLTFTVITQPMYTSLFAEHPAVRKTIGLERRTSFFKLVRNLWGIRTQCQGEPLIDLHGSLRSRLLSLLWSGSVMRFPKFTLARRLFLRSRKACYAKKLATANVTQRYALAIEEKGSTPPPCEALYPCITLSAQEHEWAQQELALLLGQVQEPKQGVQEQGQSLHGQQQGKGQKTPIIALHPYASHAGKTWPTSYWLTLIEGLVAEGLPYIIVGQGTPLPNIPAKHEYTNKTNVQELCALLAASTIVITSDSGPMHLADALGTPLIALFGPTTRDWGFMPMRAHHIILEQAMPCRPCSLHGQNSCERGYACLTDTTPDHVMQAIATILSDSP